MVRQGKHQESEDRSYCPDNFGAGLPSIKAPAFVLLLLK